MIKAFVILEERPVTQLAHLTIVQRPIDSLKFVILVFAHDPSLQINCPTIIQTDWSRLRILVALAATKS